MWFTLENTQGCENLPSLQEQVAGSSAERCSGGERSVPSKLRNTREASSCRDKKTESSTSSRSGMTLEHSTADRGERRSMSSVEVSHVKTSVLPEKDLVLSEENGVGYGESMPGSFARYDRATASWKTHQCSLFGGLESFSATWPRSGMMRRGKCYQLATAAHRMNGRGCGLSEKFPPPTVFGNNNRKGISPKAGDGLATYVKKFPTPCSHDSFDMYLKDISTSKFDSARRGLVAFVRKWPTPVASDHKSVKGSLRIKLSYAIERGATKTRKYPTPCSTDATKWNNMTPEERQRKGQAVRLFNVVNEDGEKNGGRLNPDWVEWLMGWPIGWTASRPLGTDRFRLWLQGRFAN